MKDLGKLPSILRVLSVDMIERAGSGHPGICLGIADILTALYQNHIRFNPNDPRWPNRDLFVLSAGHGSAILYSLLYLTGYKDITIDDLKNFRQLHSKTSGHPEYGLLDGVEVATGPLGQGIANAVGFAIGYKNLSAKFGSELFNNKIYCLVGDGCLMEGISQEAISFASHYKLDNLVIIFDNNSISIDGMTSLATSENHIKRFEALGFECYDINGHDLEEINTTFDKAKNAKKPVFISAKTIIGYKSTKCDSEKSHGSPLGSESIAALKQALSWSYEPFDVPESILSTWRSFWHRNEVYYDRWVEMYKNHSCFNEIESLFSHAKFNTTELANRCIDLITGKTNQATRVSSGLVLEKLLELHGSRMICGSADLSHSTNMINKFSHLISSEDYSGNYISYGIREHAMAAIANALSIIGFLPVASTFFVFSDYMRSNIRLSCLMKLRNIFIMTHDSVFLGEDGSTHQPIEHLDSLRLVPNLHIYRPCDAEEVVQSYIEAIDLNGTAMLVLTRQIVPFIQNKKQKPTNGAYVIFEDLSNPNAKKCCIIASGSEVALAIEVAQNLVTLGVNVCVVSAYCIEPYSKIQKEYIWNLMNCDIIGIMQIAIEAGSGVVLQNYVNRNALIVNIDQFGYSGKEKAIKECFGFTVSSIMNKFHLQYSVK